MGLRDPFVRQTASYLVVGFFLITMLALGFVEESGQQTTIPDELDPPGSGLDTDVTGVSSKSLDVALCDLMLNELDFPDFGRVVRTRTLEDGELNFGA